MTTRYPMQSFSWIRTTRCIVPTFLTLVSIALLQSSSRAVGAQEPLLSEGVYSEAQASRGERLYRDRCESCHAPDLQGSENAPPLRGEAFLDEWDGEVVTELMLFVQDRMLEEVVAGLSDGDYADVIAFLLATNGFPPGDELTVDSMQQIAIEPRD